ncbi:DNA primase, large subunit [Nitzschia inconspicua]|uniref:DNA primase, large subunit n=1 Tax=Nitzschia inconspicua TaxID=303405 RepID=A0A9K3LT79_9STRA|nr:DNA primase, large subunit [Nitzschia inconspicua]
MNIFKSSRSSSVPKSVAALDSQNSAGNTNINLYQEIPNIEVSLDDFEEFALDRLKVLKKLEQLKMRHVAPEKYKKYLDPFLQKLNDPTKDWISHFVLRLAYCRSEDLRRWFLAQEVALLKYRLSQSNPGSSSNSGGETAITKALKSVLPNVHVLAPEELEPLLPKILAATPSLNMNPLQVGNYRNANSNNNIYRVPFTQALDLVQHRQVFVKKGTAYIPESKLLSLVTARFRSNLSRQLALLSAVPTTPALQRTQGFLRNVATVHAIKDEYLEQGAGTDGVQLTANNVASHVKHMPLCMAQLQMALNKEKHLKHWGRLQYGLFLKGAGLSLEDAMVYFERMFVGKDFNKEYSYNFRHMYGKEGKRANYPPYNCAKIINGNGPNANEHHGCPYKHSTVQDVTAMLNKLGIAPSKQKGIIAQQQSHNYQLACVEHFKAMYPNPPTSVYANDFGNHPNAWFKSSVKASGGADAKMTDSQTIDGKKSNVASGDVDMNDPNSVSP